jgi:hypothetical protein
MIYKNPVNTMAITSAVSSEIYQNIQCSNPRKEKKQSVVRSWTMLTLALCGLGVCVMLWF